MPPAVVSTVTPSCCNREAKLHEQLNLQVEHLSAEQKLQLTQLITRYADSFALGATSLVKYVFKAASQIKLHASGSSRCTEIMQNTHVTCLYNLA